MIFSLIICHLSDFSAFLFLVDAKTCSDDQFTCDNQNCIPSRWKCDGDPDCADSSDEKRCLTTIRPIQVCSGKMFRCTEGTCVQGHWRCDGEEDCPDGSDEQSCSKLDLLHSLTMISMLYFLVIGHVFLEAWWSSVDPGKLRTIIFLAFQQSEIVIRLKTLLKVNLKLCKYNIMEKHIS